MVSCGKQTMMKRIVLMLGLMLSLVVTGKAGIVERSVSYTVNGETCVGFVAYDDASKAARPVVLVIHEWWGINDYAKDRARKLAGLGYFAFAADMYGNGKIAETPQQAMEYSGVLYQDPALALARMEAAVKECKAFPQANSNKVAAIGYCFGGSMVLNASKMGMNLNGGVSFHGGLKGVPAVKGKTKAPLLVCHGGADPFVPEDEVKAFRANCDEAGVKYTFEVYPGATHAFTNPYSTEAGQKFNLPIAYNKEADEKSWSDMLAFFKTIKHQP